MVSRRGLDEIRRGLMVGSRRDLPSSTRAPSQIPGRTGSQGSRVQTS